ncbi:hypothetical protein MTO96_024600 [Rhipicephalus appendiculatus]
MLALGMVLWTALQVNLVPETSVPRTSAGTSENVSGELPGTVHLVRDFGPTELPLPADYSVAPGKRVENGSQRSPLVAGAQNTSRTIAWPASTSSNPSRRNAGEISLNDGLKRLLNSSVETTCRPSTLPNIKGEKPSEDWDITSQTKPPHIKNGNVSACGNDHFERPDMMASALNGWLPSMKHSCASERESIAMSCLSGKAPHLIAYSKSFQGPSITCSGVPYGSYAMRSVIRSYEDAIAHVYVYAPLVNGGEPFCPVENANVQWKMYYATNTMQRTSAMLYDDGIDPDDVQNNGVYTGNANFFYGEGLYHSYIFASSRYKGTTVSGQPSEPFDYNFYSEVVVANAVYENWAVIYPLRLRSVSIDQAQIVPAVTVQWMSTAHTDNWAEIWMGLQATELSAPYLTKAGVLVDLKNDVLKGTTHTVIPRGQIAEVVVRVPVKLLDRIPERHKTATIYVSLVTRNVRNIRSKPSLPLNVTITVPPKRVNPAVFFGPSNSFLGAPSASLWTVLSATATVLVLVWLSPPTVFR